MLPSSVFIKGPPPIKQTLSLMLAHQEGHRRLMEIPQPTVFLYFRTVYTYKTRRRLHFLLAALIEGGQLSESGSGRASNSQGLEFIYYPTASTNNVFRNKMNESTFCNHKEYENDDLGDVCQKTRSARVTMFYCAYIFFSDDVDIDVFWRFLDRPSLANQRYGSRMDRG